MEESGSLTSGSCLDAIIKYIFILFSWTLWCRIVCEELRILLYIVSHSTHKIVELYVRVDGEYLNDVQEDGLFIPSKEGVDLFEEFLYFLAG